MDDLKTKIIEQPFLGSMLVIPNDGKAHPGLVTLHGSEGGGFPTWKITATRMAQEGFAVLAFAYFGSKDSLTGPRQTLADIEIEDVIKAIEWLKNSKFVKGKKIGLDGTSRGGELALLVGSLLEDQNKKPLIDSIVVHAPASAVWGSWNYDWMDERCWLGQVPEFAEINQKSSKYSWNSKCGPDPRDLPEHLKYAWKWKGNPLQTSTPIEIQNIRCPVFLSQGMKDSVWPAQQALDIEKQLIENKIPHETAFYPEEDHGLTLEARHDRQKRAIRFLHRYLNE